MPTAMIDLPPPDVDLFELLRDWPQCLAVRLFTNVLPQEESRGLLDYQEPAFPGYEPCSIHSWTEEGYTSDGMVTAFSALARWRCAATIAPVIIRGWWITALYADGFLSLVTEFTATEPTIIGTAGQEIVSPIRLTVYLVDEP